MSWNNSKETRRFKAEQERNKKYYEENGMTDEQIQTMFDYDKAVFLKERNFNETLTALRVEHLEDTDEDELTPFEEIVEPYHDEYDPFEFGFQNDALYAMIKQCDSIDLVIVSMLMCGCTRNEIMHEIGISKMAISKRIKKMREFLKKFYELVYK